MVKTLIDQWESIIDESIVRIDEFFRIIHDCVPDRNSEYHQSLLKELQEFLLSRVGKDAILCSDETSVIKLNLKDMKGFDKLWLFWNENVGLKDKSINDLISLFKQTIGHSISVYRLRDFLNEAVKAAVASKKIVDKRKKCLYNIDYIIDEPLANQMRETLVEKYRAHEKKYRHKSKSKTSARKELIFKSDQFTSLNGKEVTIIPKEQATAINKLFSDIIKKNTEMKTEIAELLDEVKILTAKIRLLEAAKVSSVSETIDDVREMVGLQ